MTSVNSCLLLNQKYFRLTVSKNSTTSPNSNDNNYNNYKTIAVLLLTHSDHPIHFYPTWKYQPSCATPACIYWIYKQPSLSHFFWPPAKISNTHTHTDHSQRQLSLSVYSPYLPASLACMLTQPHGSESYRKKIIRIMSFPTYEKSCKLLWQLFNWSRTLTCWQIE